VGVGYDTRDNEFFPSRGVFHQFGIKGVGALPLSADMAYFAVGGVMAMYVPLASSVVFAARGLADGQVGHVPFYDLSLGGIFQTDEMPGGPFGIRGVPIGRYRGRVKLLANFELRALLVRFNLFGAHFRLGGDVFADAGRAFSDYHFRNDPGEHGVAVKWGTGAGLYLQWGQAAVFRAEAAYSADARANGGFPLGVYVAQGVMF
jgi:outer membrane protein assembly factor BamA